MEVADVYMVLDYAMRALSHRRLDRHEMSALLDPEQNNSALRNALIESTARAVAPYLEGSARRNLAARHDVVGSTRIPNAHEEELLMAHQQSFVERLNTHDSYRPLAEPADDAPEARTKYWEDALEAWRYGRQEDACATTEPPSGRWEF